MVIEDKKMLSVPETAALAGVTRSTINNWINNKKLYAIRSGRNYAVPAKELLIFFRSTGREIPSELQSDDLKGPLFKNFQYCWDYQKDTGHEEGCKGCVVLDRKLDVCFTARGDSKLDCTVECCECRYYREIYLPRIQFIHQLDVPAAVCKGLFFWVANSRWASINRILQKEFIGMGIERLIHPNSLERVISAIRKMELGESLPMTFNIFLKSKTKGKQEASVSLFPLNEPPGTFLFLAKMEGGVKILLDIDRVLSGEEIAALEKTT